MSAARTCSKYSKRPRQACKRPRRPKAPRFSTRLPNPADQLQVIWPVTVCCGRLESTTITNPVPVVPGPVQVTVNVPVALGNGGDRIRFPIGPDALTLKLGSPPVTRKVNVVTPGTQPAWA